MGNMLKRGHMDKVQRSKVYLNVNNKGYDIIKNTVLIFLCVERFRFVRVTRREVRS